MIYFEATSKHMARRMKEIMEVSDRKDGLGKWPTALRNIKVTDIVVPKLFVLSIPLGS
jgi:hypothetical protein